MYAIEGNSQSGVVRLDYFINLGNSVTYYLKYQLIEGDADTMWDDVLLLDYFDTEAEAQGDYTEKTLTYGRMYE